MAEERGQRRPKYLAIAADLAARIKQGEYDPGQALPAQRELSASYGVTLMTMRQALSLLVAEGLITQHAGRGTFVSGPKAAYRMGPLRSLSDDLKAQGHTVDTVLLARGRRRLPGEVRQELGLEPGGWGLRIERLRRLGGVPAIHQVSWVPDAYAGSLAQVDFSATSLYAALASAGVVVEHARERVSPAVLDEAAGALLHRPAGVPVFLSDRVSLCADGTPVVVDRATIVGDLVEIRTERAATSLSMRWSNAH